jgi:DNA-binding GntR family transcriptional regulator
MENNFKFEKKNKTSFSAMTYESIRDAILKGNLKPGEKIVENELSEQMGISRGPIREALIRLEHEGLVFSQPYKDTVVAEICTNEVEQVFVPIRRIIETYAALNANSIMSDDDFQTLSLIVKEMHDASVKDNLDMISENDIRFHDLLIQTCVSSGLFNIWKNISGKIHSRFLYQGIMHATFDEVVTEHTEYLKLIKEGNPDKIKIHLDKHIY